METLKRWTGAQIGVFGELIPEGCGWDGCESQAVAMPCNAEGDAGRAHHWLGLHVLDKAIAFTGPGWFCETHGLKALAANDRIRASRRAT